MSPKDDEIHRLHNEEDDDQGGEGGEGGKSGGAGGHIEFREFIGSGTPERDDLLPSNKRALLLAEHAQTHEARVKKQKATLERYAELRAGKVSLSVHRQGSGATHAYSSHPILSEAAQFSGVDNKVNPLPNDNQLETNDKDQEKLEYQYDLTNRLTLGNRFNPPKPSPV